MGTAPPGWTTKNLIDSTELSQFPTWL